MTGGIKLETRLSLFTLYQESLDGTFASASFKVGLMSPRQKDLLEIKVLGGPPYPLDPFIFISLITNYFQHILQGTNAWTFACPRARGVEGMLRPWPGCLVPSHPSTSTDARGKSPINFNKCCISPFVCNSQAVRHKD